MPVCVCVCSVSPSVLEMEGIYANEGGWGRGASFLSEPVWPGGKALDW